MNGEVVMFPIHTCAGAMPGSPGIGTLCTLPQQLGRALRGAYEAGCQGAYTPITTRLAVLPTCVRVVELLFSCVSTLWMLCTSMVDSALLIDKMQCSGGQGTRDQLLPPHTHHTHTLPPHCRARETAGCESGSNGYVHDLLPKRWIRARSFDDG